MNHVKFLGILLLCFCSLHGIAQKKKPKKPSAGGNKLANQYHAAIAEMKKTATYKASFKSSCNPKSKLNELKPRDLFIDKKKLAFHMDSLMTFTKFDDDHGYIYAITTTDNYQDYLIELKGNNIGGLKKPKWHRKNYEFLKRLKQKGFDFGSHKLSKKGCNYTIENKIRPTKWTIKQTDKKKNIWIANYDVVIVVRVQVECSCKGKTTNDVKSALFEYQGPGNFETVYFINANPRSIKYNFKFLKKPQSKVLLQEAICCQPEDISYEDPLLENTTQEIGSLPNQTLGGFIGAGFQENFDETTFCVGTEYLHNVSQIGNSPLMVGGGVHYSNTSFFEVNTSSLAIGPTAQLFTPITSNGSVYLVNGVSAQYAFGSQDAFGFESNFSGFNGLLNTGLYVPINDQLGVSLVIPVLSVQSTTFKPNEGEGSFTDSSTGFFLENRNAIKIGLRLGL